MTASEALEASPAGVARLYVAGGLVAIARAADGYQVSFVPRDTDGVWNLAGTHVLGSWPDIDEAVECACAEREVSCLSWESAPENLIGDEPARSTAPGVEGHHILRTHGLPRERE